METSLNIQFLKGFRAPTESWYYTRGQYYIYLTLTTVVIKSKMWSPHIWTPGHKRLNILCYVKLCFSRANSILCDITTLFWGNRWSKTKVKIDVFVPLFILHSDVYIWSVWHIIQNIFSYWKESVRALSEAAGHECPRMTNGRVPVWIKLFFLLLFKVNTDKMMDDTSAWTSW